MHKYVFLGQRLAGYIVGFLLFYEPFAYFYKLCAPFFPDAGFTTIHVPCAKVPMYAILGGGLDKQDPISYFFCLLLVLVSLWLGPLFCGRLCPAGAFGEFLSQLVPARFQLNWSKLVPVLPLRYGFFVGFLFSGLLGLGLPCTYCNYYAFELFVGFLTTGRLMTTSAALLGTFFLTFIILGMWSKGGRGYCQLLCPVGTLSMLLHTLGKHLPGSMAMQVQQPSCVGCGSCARTCPMQAIKLQERKAEIDIRRCITCGKCQHVCPKGAICYDVQKEQGHAE